MGPPRAIGRLSTAVKLVASIAILGALAFFIDFRNIGRTLFGMGALPLLACVALLTLSQYLSSVRFYYLLRDHGIVVPRGDAFRANIYSLVGGLLLFNVFGQGITRSVLLHQYRVPQSTIFFLTLTERAVAMLLLLAAAFVGAALLFDHFPGPNGGGAALLLRCAVVWALVLAPVVRFGLTRRQRRQLRLFCRNFASAAMLRLIGMTLLVQGATLACYVIIVTNTTSTAHTGEIAAASVIVMLVAALPISFAGWGFRELSASLAFSHIGLAYEQGFAVGVSIGLLSIVALACNIASIGLRPSVPSRTEAPSPGVARPCSLEYAVYWLFALGAAVAVLFQVRIPTHSGEINVNLGDPLAIIGALIVLGLAWQTRGLLRFWRAPWLLPAIGAVTIVLAAGLLHGYALYGPIDWAIFNRFIGWLILLAYFCSGALIVIVSGRAGFSALRRVLVAGTAGLVIWEIVHRFLTVVLDVAIGDPPSLRAEAVAGNPNAFTFQLLMAFSALIASSEFRHRRRSVAWPEALAGLLLAGIWLAGSRAGVVALVAVIATIPALFRSTTDRTAFFSKLALAVAIGSVALIVTDFAATLVNWNAGGPGLLHALGNLSGGLAFSTADVQADRIESLQGGLALWAEHPFFGAGLGAYIQGHIARTGTPLIIHNSLLWVAAELGLVGLCAYGFLFVAIGNAVCTRREGTDSKALVVGCIVAFAVVSLAHDMIYQRVLWLLLGAAMASPCALRLAGAIESGRVGVKPRPLA
jgi:O-antigen ligase